LFAVVAPGEQYSPNGGENGEPYTLAQPGGHRPKFTTSLYLLQQL